MQRYYGEDNPNFSCSYVGFKNGETSEVLDTQPTVFTTATKESVVGTYPIYCTGAEAKNYDISYSNGILSIAKAPQNIDWEQEFEDVEIGDEIELTATSNSGLSVKYKSSNQDVVIISTKKENSMPIL